MNPSNRLISIPTKTYLKKFIEKEVGKDVITPGDHPIQTFLYALLEKKDFNYSFKEHYRSFDTSMQISVSYFVFHQVGRGISPSNVVLFNDYVEQLFDQELYKIQQHLKYQQALQEAVKEAVSQYNIKLSRCHQRNWFQVPKQKDALEQFAKKYDLEIEVDITFEALKKMEYRARKRFEKEQLSPETSFSITNNSLLLELL
jgi:hypothetical protein